MIWEDMDQGPIVLDISSDEEPNWGEPKSVDFDLLSELLADIDKQTEDDSDEVVVVSEVNPKRRPKYSKTMVREPDDDCVVLDGDPDKPVKAVVESENGSDEILIVGEKGQVACRDFPHPRHLCATFLFCTTPHQIHCHLCHCYICDLPAPCLLWGTGVSCNDHCHATDKEETWKIQRKNLKLVKNVPLQTSKFPVTCSAAPAPQSKQVRSPLTICLSSESRPHNQLPRPATIHPCSSSANFPVSNIVNQGRSQQSGHGFARNRFPPRTVPRHSLVSHVHIQGRKGHDVSNLGPQFVSYRPLFKRPGTTGDSLPAKQSSYSSLNNSTVSADTTQYATNPVSMPASNDLNANRWENFSNSTHQSSPVANLASDPLPKAQTYGYHMPPPLLNHSQSFYQQENQFQNNGQTIYQCGNQSENESQNLRKYQCGNQSENESQNLRIYQCGNQSENESQNLSQDNNHGARSVDEYIDFDQILVNDNTQSNQLLPNEPSQLQSTDYTYEPSIQEIEKWLLDDQSLNVSLPPIPNISSNQSVPIETGMLLFDFETSLNGLMHTK